MRALGDVREERARSQALTEQFNFYGKGEGAWSALDALARIGHPSSVPLFKAPARRQGSAPATRGGRRTGSAGDTSELPALEIGAGNDASDDGARGDGLCAAEARAQLRRTAGRVPRLGQDRAAGRRRTSSSSGRRSLPGLSIPRLQDPTSGDPRQRRATFSARSATPRRSPRSSR